MADVRPSVRSDTPTTIGRDEPDSVRHVVTPPTLTSSGFVGRVREFAGLHEAWTVGGRFVVVRGAAGIGKSRLVHELVARAELDGGVGVTGRCTERSQMTPLRPIAELLLASARRGCSPPAEMSAFVPPLARFVPEWGASSAVDVSELVLGEALLRLAAAHAGRSAAALLVIEDVQWADDQTVALLDYVADSLPDHRVTVVVTLRDSVIGPGAALADRLATDRRASVINVPPLVGEEVALLAQHRLGVDRVPTEVVDVLVARCDGVPFLVEELLDAGGALDSVRHELPSSIAASVQARLAELPESAARLVRHAALLGRVFPWRVVANAADVPADEIADALRAGVRVQLLEQDRDEFRFRHALTRDAVLADILGPECATMSAALLDALTGTDSDLAGDALSDAIDLAEAAGQLERAAELATRAAHRARAGGALAIAEELARRAQRLAPLAPGATIALLATLAERGQFDAAAVVANAFDFATHAEAEYDASVLLAEAAVRADRWADARAVLHVLRSSTVAAVRRDLRVDVLDARIALGESRPDDAMGHAAVAAGSADPATAAEAWMVVGRIERLRDPTAGEAAFTRAREIAGAAGLRAAELQALQELGTIDLYLSGDDERILAARAAAEAAGAVSTLAIIDLQLAALYGERLELDASLAAARRSQDLASRFGLASLAMAIAIEAAAHAKAGRRAELECAAARARATGADVDNVEILISGNAWAAFHIHRNDREAALDALEAALERQSRSPLGGTPFGGLWPLLATVTDHPIAAHARRTMRGFVYDTPMSRAMTDAADAVSLGDAVDQRAADGVLASVDERLRRYHGHYRLHLTQWLVAPRAHAAGWGAPEAWLREALAGFERLGLDVLARCCREELRGFGAAVPRRARSDVVVPADLARLGITGREYEVLQLVAQGLGNRAIADRLFLSPRTVEKHVERLTMKAACGRAELAALLRT